MENEAPLAVPVTTTEKRICKCCKNELPLNHFKRYSRGYSHTCMSCERKSAGVSEKFKNFTDRELMEELRSRGFKGTLKYYRIEEYKV